MSGHPIGLDKCPVVRSVGVGETWRRILAKCVLAVIGLEAKEACGTEQLCRELESGIKGGICAVRLLWQQTAQEEDWGFLLIDAQNAFNEENRTTMLWAVRHKWTGDTQFTFNCYRHWATLVVRHTADG